MHPSFEIFGLEIHFYSIFFMLGLVAGCLMLAYGDKRLRKKYSEQLLDAYLYILVGIILGSKLLYILVNLNRYTSGNIVNIWQDLRTGFLFYGGLIGALIASFLYFRKKNLPIWHFVDAAAPAIPLGHAIGRIGCMFAGCCYGSHTNLPWAVIYPETCPIAPGGTPLHPYPIYELIGNLAIFGLILLLRYRIKVKGRMMSVYLMGYAALRFALDYTRGDYVQDMWIFSTAQVISFVMFALGLVSWFVLAAKKERTLDSFPEPVKPPKKQKKVKAKKED